MNNAMEWGYLVGWGSWLACSAGFAVLMVLWPLAPSRERRVGMRSRLWRLLAGEMAIMGTLRIGLGLAGGLWWGGAAGMLTFDLARLSWLATVGGVLLAALVNAGRRARLTPTGYGVLGGLTGLCAVMVASVLTQAWSALRGCG